MAISVSRNVLKLSDLAHVVVRWERNTDRGLPNTQTYLIPREDLDLFFEATIKLHYAPGMNPHNNGATTKVSEIKAYALEINSDYWWASPGLGMHDAPHKPARIIGHNPMQVLKVWKSPEQIERDRIDLERYMAEED